MILAHKMALTHFLLWPWLGPWRWVLDGIWWSALSTPWFSRKMKRSYVPVSPTLQRRWDKMDQARMADPGRTTESA